MSWPLGLVVRVPGPDDDKQVEAVVIGTYEETTWSGWDHGVVVRYDGGARRTVSYMFVDDEVEMPVAAAARVCGLDATATEALYKAVKRGDVVARELRTDQNKPRRYVRVEAVRAWATETYKARDDER